MTKPVFLVDVSGRYLGTLAELGARPEDAIEVPHQPDHIDDRWNGEAWLPAPRPVTRHFVDPASGAYLGAFGPGTELPAGATEVADPPEYGADIWDAEAGAFVPGARPDPDAETLAAIEADPRLLAIVDMISRATGVSKRELADSIAAVPVEKGGER